MSISIGVFLFGYGISLSGHTLYQLFCKNHQNIEQSGSGKDDEEWINVAINEFMSNNILLLKISDSIVWSYLPKSLKMNQI